MFSTPVRNPSISITSPYSATERNKLSAKTIQSVILFAVLLVSPVMGQGKKWDALMAAGNSQNEKGQLNESEKAYREALPIAEKFGNKDARLATSLIKLAVVCEAQAKHDEAYALTNRALMVLSNATNSYKNLKLTNLSESEYYKIETTVIILDHAADNYSAQERYTDAEPVLKVVVTIREGVARKKKAKINEDFFAFMVQAMTGAFDKVSNAYEKLATLYLKQGYTADTVSLYNQALKYTQENNFEEKRNAEARIHNLFGELYFKHGKYAEAETAVEKALKIYQQDEIKNSPPSAVALSNLATFYVKQEKYYDNALSYFRQALSIFQKAGWRDQLEIADTLENYAILLTKLGKEAEAVEMTNRAKEIRAKQPPTKSN